ncbi:cation:proton antiporter [Marinithermus hydrothermalis]|uniref:Sodium/hydrogen exchanger n=1 Tax=Marinithermus hydrothermalis (strain DSM 14884 / JCM 11576 / T1) TaxID=869210 RepID=F2NLU2_MARHT|nr:cation:proton antiporter [Marinithermus hydrothermalis]AEB10922.1 sodium/hydrogen exchanger [Marinithermus hydrothermalis DSM 14884]
MSESVLDFTLAAALLALGAALVHRFRFPPLPAYLLVGLAIGARLDVEALEPLPSLGLLLLLFSVGLEFGLDRLGTLARWGTRAGGWDALALVAGSFLGLILGLDLYAAVLLGGVLYASSSAVIAKLIIDLRRAASPESEVALTVLVFEDLVIALVLALFGGHGDPAALVWGVALAAGYLAFTRWGAGRLVPWVERFSDELVLLLGAAFVTGTATLFHAVGASGEVGAFLAGVVAAGLGLRERFEHLFAPVRDLAVAFFFLTVGAQALGLLAGLTLQAVLLVALGVLLKLGLDYRAGRAAGLDARHSALAAAYLVPRGEFNLILGALALQAGQTLVAQVAVLSVLVTVPLGALLIRYAPEWTRRRATSTRTPSVKGGEA